MLRELVLKTPQMALIRSMTDGVARKRRVLELFYIVQIEHILDLIAATAKSPRIWTKDYEQEFCKTPFHYSLANLAQSEAVHLRGDEGYHTMIRNLGENRADLKQYGIQDGWFRQKGTRNNIWQTQAKKLWENAVDCVESLFRDTTGTLLKYPELWAKKEVKNLLNSKRGARVEEDHREAELDELLNVMPANETKWDLKERVNIIKNHKL